MKSLSAWEGHPRFLSNISLLTFFFSIVHSLKRRRESGYFQNIFQELKAEDWMGFKDMFRMSVTDY